MIYLASDHNTNLLAPQMGYSITHIAALLCALGKSGRGRGKGTVQGQVLTDAYESGNCPLCNICVLVMQAFS